MMTPQKKFVALFISFWMIADAMASAEKSIQFSSKNLKEVAFISHQGDANFMTYLAMNLDYSPVKKLFPQMMKLSEKHLKNRGEAHITVVTPPEFDHILKPFLSMTEIDEIAESMHIQKSDIKPLCVGSGQKNTMYTYFVVVESQNLLKIRKKIHERYVENGGALEFKPEHYFPHITLGYTHRDLHETDGVIKDIRSCAFFIEDKE